MQKKFQQQNKNSTISFLLSIFFFLLTNSFAQNIVRGYISDQTDNTPLLGANILILHTDIGTTTNKDGYFEINCKIIGKYKLKVSYVGYNNYIKNVEIKLDSVINFDIKLKRKSYKLKNIVITPSSYLSLASTNSQYSFSSKELENVPDPSNDIMRKMQSIAGVETDNLNARIGIRGSYFSDMLYLVDGIEVYEPFHMKSPPGSNLQLEGAISIISDEIVDNVDLLLGGFSAKYGNKNGGIFSINTLSSNSENLSGSVFISLMSAGVLVKKSFNDNSFLFSYRRGYFDFLFNLLGGDENVVPHYSDMFLKYNWKINNSNNIFFEYLRSSDDYNFTNSKGVTTSKLKENTNYLWGGWEYIGAKSFINKLIFFTSILPSKMTWNEFDITHYDNGYNETNAKSLGIKNDIYFDMTDWYGIESGVSLRYTENQFGYYKSFNYKIQTDSTGNLVEVDKLYKGYLGSAYLNNKFHVLNNLYLESGIRYDYQSYFIDGGHQLSPRFALSFLLPFHTTLRLAYGTYYQPTDIANLYSFTNESRFKELKGTHYILGIDNNFFSNLFIRLEGYYKKMDPTLSYIINKNEINYLERSYAKGIDLLMRYNKDNLAIVSTYSLSTARDVSVDGKEFFRSMDRTHRFSFALVYKLGTWSFGLNVLYMTGNPYTSLQFDSLEVNGQVHWSAVSGEYKISREKPFNRIDFSINKEFNTSLGKINLQLEIINILNYKSVYKRKWSWEQDENGNFYPYEDFAYTFPLIPSIGLNWKF